MMIAVPVLSGIFFLAFLAVLAYIFARNVRKDIRR